MRALIEGYLREVAETAKAWASEDRGKDVLASVPGRPLSEDAEIGLDRQCDILLDRWCLNSGVDIEVHSEHGTRRPSGGPGAPELLISVDPFDGSGLYKRGLPAEWWSVLTVYQAEGLRPVAGGAADIVRGEMYLADPEGVTVRPLDSGPTMPMPPPSKEKALGGEQVIAAYLMDPAYLTTWTQRAAALMRSLNREHRGVRVWPNGGSCIFPWLARGLVHAYVMFDEPRTEIDPGLAFASFARFPVYSVTESGAMEIYRFDPEQSAGRVGFFVAACTQGLAEDIVEKVLNRPAV